MDKRTLSPSTGTKLLYAHTVALALKVGSGTKQERHEKATKVCGLWLGSYIISLSTTSSLVMD
jgi:hypothetical protein